MDYLGDFAGCVDGGMVVSLVEAFGSEGGSGERGGCYVGLPWFGQLVL